MLSFVGVQQLHSISIALFWDFQMEFADVSVFFVDNCRASRAYLTIFLHEQSSYIEGNEPGRRCFHPAYIAQVQKYKIKNPTFRAPVTPVRLILFR